jgi:hypothetical protein
LECFKISALNLKSKRDVEKGALSKATGIFVGGA